MKAKSPLPRYSLGLALILVPITAVRSAQTTPSDRPGAGVTGARADPETIELSPFVVNTDKDAGFAAASALTGGRLASDLRDTPAAYSVITREFIDALGITDLMQAAEWSTASTFNPDTGTSNFSLFRRKAHLCRTGRLGQCDVGATQLGHGGWRQSPRVEI
jgi:outer membrane receptor for ferric coprogen and ferric-rhodotorulic acid